MVHRNINVALRYHEFVIKLMKGKSAPETGKWPARPGA